jgi:hypothetical protein
VPPLYPLPPGALSTGVRVPYCGEAPGESNHSRVLSLTLSPIVSHHGRQAESHEYPLPGSSAGKEEKEVQAWLSSPRFQTSERMISYQMPGTRR